jgi:uncharacterized protein YdeI (YjbR/CyaY-like superfamily)
MPRFVREALDAEDLGGAYEARPAYQRNDYIGWINRAQLPDTREQRLAQMLDELRRGDVYMHASWRPLRAALDDASAILGMRDNRQ